MTRKATSGTSLVIKVQTNMPKTKLVKGRLFRFPRGPQAMLVLAPFSSFSFVSYGVPTLFHFPTSLKYLT